MADEPEVGELPAEEKAYHESRGEKMPAKEEVKVDVEEKAEAETKTEADELLDEEPKKDDPKVPLRALTKEREESKKSKAALQEMEKRFAVLEDRWNTMLAATTEPLAKVDEDPEPDPNQDIFAHNAWLKRNLERTNAKIAEREQSEKQAAEEVQRETAVWNYWHESAAAAKAANPDFGDAVTWMAQERVRQLSALKALHPQFQTEAGINRQIDTELKQIIVAAAQNQMNPADYVYEMAKQWGYKGPAPKEEPKPDTGGLEKLSKDMEAETSLSSAGGSRPGGALDATAIANMSPSDFEAWYAKNGAAAFKRLQTRGNA